MPSKSVAVGSSVGLHARPAALVAAAASEYDDDITLEVPGGDGPVDAASAMFIMTLGAERGTEVIVSSENEAAVAQIAALIERDLDA